MLYFNCIPEALYNSEVFSSIVQDEEKALLELPLAALNFAHFEDCQRLTEGYPKILKYCLCILLSHAEASREELFGKMAEFNVDETILFQGLLIAGRWDLLDECELGGVVLKQAVLKDDCLSFRILAAMGDVDGMKRLIQLYPESTQEMINAKGGKYMLPSDDRHMIGSSHPYGAFRQAIREEQLDVLNLLKDMTSEEHLQTMMAECRFFSFSFAALLGRLESMKWMLREVSPDKLPELFSSGDFWCHSHKYYAFIFACEYGHLQILHWLKDNAPENIFKEAMTEIQTSLHSISRNNFLPILKWLKSETSSPDFQHFLAQSDYFIFRQAAGYGDLDALKWLCGEISTDKIPEMLEGGRNKWYPILSAAAETGHLPVLQYLAAKLSNAELSNAELTQILVNREFEAVHSAMAEGHLHILEWFIKYFSEHDIENMLNSAYPSIVFPTGFYGAAANGHLEVMEYLRTHPLAGMHFPGSGSFYEGFAFAALRGQLPVLNWYKRHFPEKMETLIQYKDFQAVEYAGMGGKPEILEWINNEAQGLPQKAVERGFLLASMNGHVRAAQWFSNQSLESIQSLISKLISDGDYQCALASPAMAGFLFRNSWVFFAQLDAQDQRYGEFCNHAFVRTQLFLWRQKIHLEGDLSLNGDEEKLGYYMLRNLICRKNAEPGDIRFLLTQKVTREFPNELPGLALRFGQTEAAELLLENVEVRALFLNDIKGLNRLCHQLLPAKKDVLIWLCKELKKTSADTLQVLYEHEENIRNQDLMDIFKASLSVVDVSDIGFFAPKKKCKGHHPVYLRPSVFLLDQGPTYGNP